MCGPRVAVHCGMCEREPDLPYTSGTPQGSARIVTGNHGRHDRHARVRRDVARCRLGRPQQARLVRVSIRKPFFLSDTKAEGEHNLVVPALYVLWRYDGAEKVRRRAGTRKESIWRVASAQSVDVLFANVIYRHISNLSPSIERARSS